MDKKNPFLIYKGLPGCIYFLFISRVIDNMGNVVMPLLTLILTEKIGFSKSLAGTLTTAFMLMMAPFLLLGGKLIDKWGSKRVIVIFNSLGALTYLPCAFIKPNLLMAGLMALASGFFAVAAPAYNSIVTELVPPQKMKSAYSIMYLGYNLGLAVGPVLGGLLFNSHIHLLFVIDTLTCLVSTTLVFFFVDDSKKQIEHVKSEMLPSGNDIKSSVFGFILKTPVMIIFSVFILVYNFCYSQWNFMLPLHTVFIFKDNGPSFYSYFLFINAVTVIMLTPMLTTLTHKFRPLAAIASGGIFYMLAFLMFAGGRYLNVFFAATVMLTIGQILININTSMFIAQRTPPEFMGRANSVFNLINGAGIAIGPAIMGNVLLLVNESFKTAWIIVAALMLAASIAMFVLNRRNRHFDA